MGLPGWSPAYLATVVPSGGRRDFGCPLTLPLACFPAPIPPTPFPGGEGGDFRLFYARGFAPCIPGAVPGRHWLSLPSRYPVQGEPEVRRKNDRTAFLLAVPAAKERGDRGRGTSAFEMVLSPGAGRTSAAQGSATPPRTTTAGQTSAAGGTSPHCVFHSGRDSRYRRRQKPTPLPSFPFPQQSPHKENHAVDERREENRQNNMRENTEPEKADRRNRTRRESRGKHAE